MKMEKMADEMRGARFSLICLFGKGHDVALQAGGVGFPVFALVDLVQIAAHTQQNAARAGGDEEGFVEFVAGLLEVFHAIAFGEHAAAVEGVDVNFLARILKTAQEMAR